MATSERLTGHGGHVSSKWLYAALPFLVLVSLAAVGSALIGHPGFPLDDSWIHQTVARNLALYGSLGYLPHQRSSGSTSLLWTLILALKYLVFRPFTPLAYSLAVNAACLLGAVLISLRLAFRDRMSAALALLWAASPLADGNFVWLSFTGMEHLLFVSLSLLTILLWSEPGMPAPLAGVAMGLLSMTRPEGLVLPALLLVVPRLVGRSRTAALQAALAALPLVIVPFAVNLFTSHALLPVTFKGRQWLYLAGDTHSMRTHLGLFLGWFHRLLYAVKAPDRGATGSVSRLLNLAGSVLIVLLCIAGLHSLWRDRCRLTLIVCAWGIIHSLLYVFILPTTGHGGRYQPFLLMLEIPLCARGLYLIAQSLWPERTARLAVPALAVLLCGAVSLALWRNTLRSGIAHIEGSHGLMASYLNAHLPGETLAVFDIGRIGYTYQGRIVDLGGLTDTAYVDFLLSGRVPDYLRQRGIHYVVLPTQLDRDSRLGDSLRLTHNPQVSLEPIYRACSPESVWWLAYLQTNNAFQCQELDRITVR